RAKLHPDCHVVFDYGFYSAPFRLVGEELWLRATSQRLEIYFEHERVATHARALHRGERKSEPDHLPPDKLQALLPVPVKVQADADAVGQATGELVAALIAARPLDRLRAAQGILRLGKRYGNARLEAACRRAVCFGEIRYQTVKTILKRAL